MEGPGRRGPPLARDRARPSLALPALGLLGAVAVLALLIPWVGAAGLWIQLDELGLPDARAVVTDALPIGAWIDEGRQMLVVPGVVATVAAGLLLVWVWWRRPDILGRSVVIAVLAVVAIAPAVAIAWELAQPEMRPAVAVLSGEDELIAGYLVAENGERTYLVAVPSGHPRDAYDGSSRMRLVAVRRDGIERLARRERASVDGANAREQAAASVAAVTSRTAVRAASAADLGRTFAPLVRFPRRERWLPMSARAFIGGSRLRFAHDEFCPDANVAVAAELRVSRLGDVNSAYRAHQTTPSCRPETWKREILTTDHSRPQDTERVAGLGIKEGFYLDLENARRGGAEVERTGLTTYSVSDVPVYVERTQLARSRILLTYWALYGRSRFREGGWQRVSVLVRRAPNGGYLPLSVRYHVYEGLYRELRWADVERVTDAGTAGAGATHPVVFSARGSHASYWRPGSFEYDMQSSTSLSPLPVRDRVPVCAECPEWRSWESVQELRDQDWYGFGGAWGEVPGGGSTSTTGPLGPSTHQTATGRTTVDGFTLKGAVRRQVTADVEELARSSE